MSDPARNGALAGFGRHYTQRWVTVTHRDRYKRTSSKAAKLSPHKKVLYELAGCQSGSECPTVSPQWSRRTTIFPRQLMRYRLSVLMFLALFQPAFAEDFEIPPEITPAIRSACEKDVRRLCIKKGSTQASVKSCVLKRFASLNTTCQYRLITAGLVGNKKVAKSTSSEKQAPKSAKQKTNKPGKSADTSGSNTKSSATEIFGIDQ